MQIIGYVCHCNVILYSHFTFTSFEMNRKLLLLFLCANFCCVCVRTTLDIRLPTVPPFSNFVNRLTNTTFGVLRGGINFFSNTVDRVTSTFGRVEDRLRELLEELRKQIVLGIPEFNIPVLDPLHIERVDFSISHESARFKGNLENITVRHISKFIIDDINFSDFGNWLIRLDLNLTFPLLRVDGRYDVDGIIGDTFRIFGDGRFWLNMYNFTVDTSTLIQFEIPRPRVVGINIDIKLQKLDNKFENLMRDKELEELFNKAISSMAPEALSILWPEMKDPIQRKVMGYANNILQNSTVANLVRRLLNIGLGEF